VSFFGQDPSDNLGKKKLRRLLSKNCYDEKRYPLYNKSRMSELTTLLLKLPRDTEVTPEAAQTFLAALTQINPVSALQGLLGTKAQPLALEIALVNQQIRFQITCDSDLVPFIETQIQSNYPLVIIEKVPDPLENTALEVASLKIAKGNYYPIATYPSFQDVDPLSSILTILAKSEPNQVTVIQYALQSTTGSWQIKAQKMVERGIKNPDGTFSPLTDESIIKEKISYPGFYVSVRIGSNSKKSLRELTSAFGVFARADANSFSVKKPSILNRKKATDNLILRCVTDTQILNIAELATIWHLPSEKIKTPSILWGSSVLSEAPDNLPAAIGATEEEKQNINFFGKTLFKNKETIFGIKDKDRRRHIWTIGKTGTGKSTLIANMAIDDLKKGRGLTVIDPHGDLCETLLDYIPKSRINDTVYFNPADKDYPIIINPLEVTNMEEAELVVSGIVSIFHKIFGFSWGPRLEYILRNSLLTLSEVPEATLKDVLTLLVNNNFRNRVVEKIQDPVMKQYWRDEYNKMPDRLRSESISPIMNKVGQFVASPLIRRVIGSPKSSIQIDNIMNEGKILIANLSQGRLGEDNSSLLGAMLITKVQLAAMRRVGISEEQRRDFYVYVDEFQNFATESFIKILSEARKYRLDLMLANQYMAQIPEEVQKAILGNAGTIISFSVGAEDAQIIYKEFAEVFSENDLVNLSNFQIATKLMVDGHATRPFLAHTLPLPVSRNQNRPKVIRVSRERWGRKRTKAHRPPRQTRSAAPRQAPRPAQQHRRSK
jgi:hypothetical protein